MGDVIPLVKKSKVSKVDIQMQIEVLEDGSLWYRFKLSKSNAWSEWKMVE